MPLLRAAQGNIKDQNDSHKVNKLDDSATHGN